MKVQLIELEAEDDHASVRDRLNWARAEKAVLVWPRTGRPLARRLDLQLVQRHAQRRGIELGLVSFDPQVVRNAKRLGLPLFESLEQLPAGPWQGGQADHPQRRSTDPSRLQELRQSRAAAGPVTSLPLVGRARLAAVAVAGAALAGVGVALLPGARIAIAPADAERIDTLELRLDPGVQAPTEDGRLPASLVATQLSGEMQIETSGRLRAPAVAASGEVEFINLTDDTLTIPAGTGLRAAELRFQTVEQVELGDEPVTVTVLADQPGRQGNLDAGEIDSVEGPLGFLVRVSNPEPTRGGRDVLTGAVSEDDRQRLHESLLEGLLTTGERALSEQLGSDRALVPGTVEVGRVIEQEFNREAGEVAEALSLGMTAEVQGLSFDLAQAEAALAEQLADSVPEGRFLVPGSLVFAPVEAETEQGVTSVRFRVRASEARQIDLSAVRRTARGAGAATVGETLRSRFRLAEPAQVELSPSWLPWLPLLEIRIQVDWIWNQG